MLTFLLLAILIALLLIYSRLKSLSPRSPLQQVFNRFKDDENQEIEDTAAGNYSLKMWLKMISENIYQVEKEVKTISNSIDIDNPAGKKSSRYKKTENLIKLYSQFLIDNEKVSPKDAPLRARFEFYRFGEDEILEQMEDGYRAGLFWRERMKAEYEYNHSDILDKDIKSHGKFIGHDLMAPMYEIIAKQNYKEGMSIHLLFPLGENNYRDFIEHRALIYQLEKLGIIKKTNEKDYQGKPIYTIPNPNLDYIRKIVYEGGASHDNAYFDGQYREGKLIRLFFINY